MQQRGDMAHRSARWVFATALVLASGASANFAPAPVLDSPLVLQIEYHSNIGTPGGSTNLAEPVAIGNDLYVIDKDAGIISIASVALALIAAGCIAYIAWDLTSEERQSDTSDGDTPSEDRED